MVAAAEAVIEHPPTEPTVSPAVPSAEGPACSPASVILESKAP